MALLSATTKVAGNSELRSVLCAILLGNWEGQGASVLVQVSFSALSLLTWSLILGGVRCPHVFVSVGAEGI